MPIITPPTQTEAELFASCRGLPTPFMDFEKVENEQRMHIRVRFYIKKRGGALHVQTADDSEFFGGRTVVIRSNQIHLHTFARAAEDLTRAFMLDPVLGGASNPHNRRLVWNKRSAMYVKRHQLVQAISLHLLNAVDPRRGRPSHEPRGIPPVPDLPIGPKGTRRARKNELLDLVASMQTMLSEPIEKAKHATRMAGYSPEERTRLGIVMSDIMVQLRRLQKDIHDDTLVQGEAQ